MALPSASEVHTTSPNHGSTSGGGMWEVMYGATSSEKHYILRIASQPRVHLPYQSGLVKLIHTLNTSSLDREWRLAPPPRVPRRSAPGARASCRRHI